VENKSHPALVATGDSASSAPLTSRASPVDPKGGRILHRLCEKRLCYAMACTPGSNLSNLNLDTK